MRELHVHLQAISQGLSNHSDRYNVIDHEHLVDKATGLKYHLYGEQPLKITLGDKTDVIMEQHDFTQQEQQVLAHIMKQMADKVSYNRRNTFMNILERTGVPS